MEACLKFQLIEGDTIASMKGLLESIADIKKRHNLTQLWYRGHSDSDYHLVPTIARQYKYAGRSIHGFDLQQERNLLHRFRRRAYPHVGRILNEWEALFLARHHELPTRILDWTASPLVALYFACASTKNLDKPANVWGIARIRDETYDLDILRLAMLSDVWQIAQIRDKKGTTEELKKFKSKLTRQHDDLLGPFKFYEERGEPINRRKVDTEDAVKIVHPFYNSPRIIAQGGVFTFHSDPKQRLDSYQNKLFHRERLDIECLIRWDIKPKVKSKIIKELDNVGINRRTVFPDLDGIARGLWETEVLWNGIPEKADR